jgi:hypothetical protein
MNRSDVCKHANFGSVMHSDSTTVRSKGADALSHGTAFRRVFRQKTQKYPRQGSNL